MITISDVAKKAEVSIATVSRVLNNPELVQVDTRKRVEKAISELNYQPNILARNFRRDESLVILILAPNIANPYYGNIINGIIDEARQKGYSALITTGESKDEQLSVLNMLSSKQADGAILLGASLGSDWLEQYYELYPLVLCSEFEPKTKIPHISIDNYGASVEIMNYLFSMGHERIATISSENSFYSTQLRLDAYKDAMASKNFSVPKEYVYKGSVDYSFQSGKEAVKYMLDLKEPPTALFCISDMLAFGSVVGALEKGYKVPEDLSIVGFDDVENTTMVHPYITTVSQPCYELGRGAVKNLYNQMQNEKVTLTTVLSHEFIVRESVRSLEL